MGSCGASVMWALNGLGRELFLCGKYFLDTIDAVCYAKIMKTKRFFVAFEVVVDLDRIPEGADLLEEVEALVTGAWDDASDTYDRSAIVDSTGFEVVEG